MGLHLHRAERTDLLADGLGALLSDPLPDPFAEELVVVPAKGVERWLSQRLSHILGRGDGAGRRLRGRRVPQPALADRRDHRHRRRRPVGARRPGLAAARGDRRQPRRAVVPHPRHAPRPLRGRRGDGAAARPALRRGAPAGRAVRVLRRPAAAAARRLGDATSPAISIADLAWQPPLWRALLDRVDAEPPHVRHAKTLARLQESPTDLPERLSLFGHTRLPATEIELLDALATHHDVHLWLPHPSDDLWQTLAGVHGPIPRRDDTSHRNVGHPLLATLGRDLRELQRSLPADPQTDEYLGGRRASRHAARLAAVRPRRQRGPSATAGRCATTTARSRCTPATARPASRRAARGAARPARRRPDARAARHPRDVPGHRDLRAADRRRLRARRRRARRAPGAPAAGAARRPVARPDQPAARRRRRNCSSSPAAGPPPARCSTSRRPSRCGAGSASPTTTSRTSPAGCARPTSAGASTASTASRSASTSSRTPGASASTGCSRAWRCPTTRTRGSARRCRSTTSAATASTWPAGSPSTSTGCSAIVESLTGARPLRGLARPRWPTASTCWPASTTTTPGRPARCSASSPTCSRRRARAATPSMRLPDVRALLGRHLAGRPTRANFRTGTLTVCTMVPMRSVPHRVVCLVGLDDGVFPRLGVVDGDDVLARDPMTGERDVRTEDRQLLLDAIGAATEKLVITYTGANEYSGQDRPPAVPLGELLDALDMHHRPTRCATASSSNTRCSPSTLATSSPASWMPDAAVHVRPDRAAGGARAAPASARSSRRSSRARCRRSPRDDVVLADLVAFFKDPVKGFFRALDYTLPWDVDGVEDAMPVDINALEEWTVGDRMLARHAARHDARRGAPGGVAARHAAAGPAGLAQGHRDPRAGHPARRPPRYAPRPRSAGVRRRHRPRCGSAADRHGVAGVRRPAGLGDLLEARRQAPARVVDSVAGVDRPRFRDATGTAVCIGRAKKGTTPREGGLGRPDGAAVELLRDLVAIYDAGRREPLPLPLKTSYAWAEARHTGDDPRTGGAATGGSPATAIPARTQAPAHVRAWGQRCLTCRTWSMPGLDHVRRARLWLPLLRAERSV